MDVVAEMLIAVTMLLAVCMALAGMRPSSTAQRYREAMETYQARQWPQAFDALAALADAGDAPAARVAALMAREGPELFGRRFEASPARLARWDRAMRGGNGAPALTARQQVALVGRAAVALEHAPLDIGIAEREPLLH
jgi:hypothetical protein